MNDITSLPAETKDWPAMVRQKAQGSTDCAFWMAAAEYIEKLEAATIQASLQLIEAATLINEMSAQELQRIKESARGG